MDHLPLCLAFHSTSASGTLEGTELLAEDLEDAIVQLVTSERMGIRKTRVELGEVLFNLAYVLTQVCLALYYPCNLYTSVVCLPLWQVVS